MNILVIEDMHIIRKGIIAKINQSFNGDSIIHEASNGIEGLQIIKNERIDLVCTDIRMPEMDGLEFIKNCKSMCEDIEYIIITGYEDFNYAHKAIELGVAGFVLKPIDDHFNMILQKAINNLHQKKSFQDVLDEKKAIEAFNRDTKLKNTLRVGLLSHDGNNVFSIEEHYHICYLIDASVAFKKLELEESIIRVLGNYDIKGVVIESPYHNKEGVVVAYHRDKDFLHSMQKKIALGISLLIRQWQCKLTVSPVIESIDASIYNDVYDTSLSAFLAPEEFIYYVKKASDDINTKWIQEHVAKILLNIEEARLDETISLIRQWYSTEGFSGINEPAYIVLSFIYTRDMILKQIEMSSKDQLMTLLFDRRNLFRKCTSLEDIGEYLIALIQKFLLKENKSSSEITYYKNIKTYIDYHYEEGISLNLLSKEFGISSSYLSSVFKKGNGITLSQYIMNKRIDKSCQYLVQTSCSIAEIAEKVGYDDPQYFYRVFKKIKGLTPMQYRKGKLKK